MNAIAIGLGAVAVAAILFGAKRASGGGDVGAVDWVPSPNFSHAARTPKDVRVIVIHTAEAPKTPHTAHDVAANWAALPTSGVSAHYAVDSDHVVQMVREPDVAWHARHANAFSIGIEHAGSAAQSPTQWADAYNEKMLARSAALVADIANRWNIPIRWLTAAELRDPNARGITGHRECTDAFENGVGHGDPGPNFPREAFIARVRGA